MHRIRWQAELAVHFQRLFRLSPAILLLANDMPDYWDTFGPDVRTLLVSAFLVANQGHGQPSKAHPPILTKV
jgi:hypothetical protein